MTTEIALAGVRVLVTGAGGFVGRHLVRALSHCKADVTALVGPPGSHLAIPQEAVEWAEIDICDGEAVRRLMRGCDVVVHAAGPPSVAQSFMHPALHARDHVQGTAAVLEAAHALSVRRIVYVSSAEVYGRSREIFATEDQPLEARSPYAACKIAAEHMIAAFSFAYRCDAVVLRPFSLYGEGASQYSVLNHIVRMAEFEERVLLADPRPIRDYVFVDDFVDAVVRACNAEPVPGVRTFNIGTMRGTSVSELAGLVLATMGLVRPVVSTWESTRPGESDIPRLIADNSRAREALGWRPLIALEEGLRRLVGGA